MQTQMRSRRLRSATSTSPFLKKRKRKRTSSAIPSTSSRPSFHQNRPCSVSTSGAQRRCPSTCPSSLLPFPYPRVPR